MGDIGKQHDELLDLLTKLNEDQLNEVDAARLRQRLIESPEARERYRRFMTLVAGLQWQCADQPHEQSIESAAPSSDLTPSDSLSSKRELPEAESPPNTAPVGLAPVKSPVLGFLGGVVDYVSHSRRLMLLLVAAMLGGWFVFQIGSVLLGRWWAGHAQMAGQENDHPVGAGRKPSNGGLAIGAGQNHGNAVAWLSGSVGSRWQVAAEKLAGGDFWEIGTEFTAGQQLTLVAGLGEITFQSGAKMVVSAPAQFAVTSPLRTELQVGKISARVPHDATGFTVDTPAGSVVDLGTEFGVEVTPDHKLDVQVFVGDVKISAPSGNGGEEAPDVHVSAGKTVHVEPGKPATVVESKENRFQRDLTIASDSGDKQAAAYLDLMRQLKPVLWLRMEGKDGERTVHDEVGKADAEVVWNGPGNPFTKGRIGKALWLRGPKLGDYAMVPDYPKAEHGKLSVCLWVYADSRPAWATMAANWRENTAAGQFQFGLFSDNPPLANDLYIGITPTDGKYFFLREGASHPLPLHEWQHVAFTTDGSTLRLYRQGREVASQKHDGLKFPVPIRSLALGTTFDSSDKTPGRKIPCYWDGKLDEIAIFNETLPAEDIQKLAAAPPQ